MKSMFSTFHAPHLEIVELLVLLPSANNGAFFSPVP